MLVGGRVSREFPSSRLVDIININQLGLPDYCLLITPTIAGASIIVLIYCPVPTLCDWVITLNDHQLLIK